VHTCGQHVQHARQAPVQSWHWLEEIDISKILRWKLSNCKRIPRRECSPLTRKESLRKADAAKNFDAVRVRRSKSECLHYVVNHSSPSVPSLNDVAGVSRPGVFLRENRVRSRRKVLNAAADQLTPVPHRFDLVNVLYLRGWVSIHNDQVC
jgi:hypothetical protein